MSLIRARKNICTFVYYKFTKSLSISKIIYASPQYWALLRMREIELRLPLGMRYQKLDIKNEAEEWIYAYFLQDRIVASCQFIIEGDKAKMRQVATVKTYQGRGIGKDLFMHCEEELRKHGIKEIYCHARKNAIPFYEKLNFEIYSDEFDEVGIPHLKMKKTLV
ncbi:MAG: GNAT family N-acetyltransferase [Chitinophagales bacterium]|nr:GNAT family N-acetyltransferase [Chitinophagales bacterium]